MAKNPNDPKLAESVCGVRSRCSREIVTQSIDGLFLVRIGGDCFHLQQVVCCSAAWRAGLRPGDQVRVTDWPDGESRRFGIQVMEGPGWDTDACMPCCQHGPLSGIKRVLGAAFEVCEWALNAMAPAWTHSDAG